ncbi:hypothetical protein [Streptomyces hirsutus]|uniref:hypothetical protein n=2 Tax=Streptomyces hirsutus TaxID=35620 RepID=UPI000AD532A5|nr:hypothetical protein [Streptomyces hirsutus]
MLKTSGAKWLMAALVTLCLGGGVLAGWLLREPAPYALRDTPEVKVTVRAAESTYPEAEEVAREVELVLEVYVQRLRSGDAADLAGVGAPWYTDREEAAQRLIAEFGAHADKPVEAVVADPVAPGLATVELRFSGGRQQVLDLTRDDEVWWLSMGNGDPVKP